MMRALTYGLLDPVDHRRGRHQRRVLDQHLLAVRLEHVVLHAGDGGDQVQVELALEALLHDLHVQQPEEAAAEAEAQRRGRLRLVLQRGVVELQLLEGVAQVLVLLRVGGVHAGEHEGAHGLVAGQWLAGPILGVEDGVAGARLLDGAHVGHHEAHLARLQLVGDHPAQLVVAHLLHLVHGVRRAEGDLHALLQHAVDHAHRGDGAAVAVVVRVVDQRAQRLVAVPAAAAPWPPRPRAARGCRAPPWR
jgi:hypothetical protein